MTISSGGIGSPPNSGRSHSINVGSVAVDENTQDVGNNNTPTRSPSKTDHANLEANSGEPTLKIHFRNGSPKDQKPMKRIKTTEHTTSATPLQPKVARAEFQNSSSVLSNEDPVSTTSTSGFHQNDDTLGNVNALYSPTKQKAASLKPNPSSRVVLSSLGLQEKRTSPSSKVATSPAGATVSMVAHAPSPQSNSTTISGKSATTTLAPTLSNPTDSGSSSKDAPLPYGHQYPIGHSNFNQMPTSFHQGGQPSMQQYPYMDQRSYYSTTLPYAMSHHQMVPPYCMMSYPQNVSLPPSYVVNGLVPPFGIYGPSPTASFGLLSSFTAPSKNGNPRPETCKKCADPLYKLRNIGCPSHPTESQGMNCLMQIPFGKNKDGSNCIKCKSFGAYCKKHIAQDKHYQSLLIQQQQPHHPGLDQNISGVSGGSMSASSDGIGASNWYRMPPQNVPIYGYGTPSQASYWHQHSPQFENGVAGQINSQASPILMGLRGGVSSSMGVPQQNTHLQQCYANQAQSNQLAGFGTLPTSPPPQQGGLPPAQDDA